MIVTHLTWDKKKIKNQFQNIETKLTEICSTSLLLQNIEYNY